MNPVPHYSWSFSSLQLFECPKKYELLRAKKLVAPPPSGAAADAGTRVHTLIEDYLGRDLWSDDLLPYKRLMELYKAKGGVCEEGYHFKKDGDVLVRCSADDPDTWFRSYLDWSKIYPPKAEVADWKSGRVKRTKQLQFYAWIIMLAHKEVDEVTCTFHFINKNDKIDDRFTRKQFEDGVLFAPFQDILDQIDQCYRLDIWPEIPGDLVKKYNRGANCTYCPVDSNLCSHGKPPEEKF